MPKAMKIKGGKFRLRWKGLYKVQKVFNNNTIELSTLNNDDMEKVKELLTKRDTNSHYDKCS
jgi:hypothetical protein